MVQRSPNLSAMHALFVTHAFPRDETDPVGSFVLRLAVALRELDVRVTVIAPRAPGLDREDVIEGIPVIRFPYASRKRETLAYTGTMEAQVAASLAGKALLLSFLSSSLAASYRLMRSQRVDIIHAHWWFPGGLVGSWLSQLTHTPLVTTMHGSDVRLAQRFRGGKRLLRIVAKHSAAMTTVSSWLAREVEALAPTAHPRVVPMPVVPDLFTPSQHHDADRLLFIGKLTEQKGLQHLLRAMTLMRTQPVLEVVGAGRVDDSHLRDLARELGVDDRIAWLPILSQSELARHYRKATIHVIPAVNEGLGLTAVESILCGTPVVAFDSGGVTDVIRNGVTGILVPPGDVQALARALDQLLEDPSKRAALAEQGRQHVQREFDRGAVAMRYAGIYGDAIGSL